MDVLANEQVAQPLRSVDHTRLVPAFDQGNLGSCTGNALAGALMTQPTHIGRRVYNETTAIVLYSQATHLDPAATPATEYPPNDPGSTGLDVCMAGIKDGYMKQFRHCANMAETLILLQYFPVIVGVNWYDSFDNPDNNGLVSISPNAQVRGGHEFELSGLQVVDQEVHAWNSWGENWGDGGKFKFSFADLERLLNEQGDSMVPLTF